MLLGAIILSWLALGASTQADIDLARIRIHEFQTSYAIDWSNRPALHNKPLNRETRPNVTVYIQRYIEQSYINTGSGKDVFSISKATTLLNDVTEGSSITAQSRTGFEVHGPVSLSISSRRFSTADQRWSTGSWKTQIQKREEICKGGYACRFESWTYFVRITGHCHDEPCEIRTPITDPNGTPLTAIVYIPEKLPEAIDGQQDVIQALEERFKADMARNYCIDWTKPPQHEKHTRHIRGTRSALYPDRRLVKALSLTVHLDRSIGIEHTSFGSADSPLTFDSSVTSIQSSTEGWAAGAETSSYLGLAPGFSTGIGWASLGGVALDVTNTTLTSKQVFGSQWNTDGFTVSTSCKKGYSCRFETWTFHAHISGLCRHLLPSSKTKTLVPIDFQSPCELDIPIFKKAGEPLMQFIGVFEKQDSSFAKSSERNPPYTRPQGISREESNDDKASSKKRVPRALGREGRNCLLDDYTYYSVQRNELLNTTLDEWVPAQTRPKDIQNCFTELPPDPQEKTCYENEIWAPLSEPAQAQATSISSVEQELPIRTSSVKQEMPTTLTRITQNASGSNSDEEQKLSTNYTSGAKQEAVKGVSDVEGWCLLSNGVYYDQANSLYWDPKGILPKPDDLTSCIAAGARGPEIVSHKLGYCWLDSTLIYADTGEYLDIDQGCWFRKPEAPRPNTGLTKCPRDLGPDCAPEEKDADGILSDNRLK
ncbi:hypothetical protein CDD82_7447 [Ophiocordyceps australis]|uniref:Uncharacterized protein n=1 Tax=Ophiocordyceps australis TaxID=1399860 RepID=A0A2C5ZQ67_9HYPO|nr:hypothetical protein CDD82_7447 [Ophiocordyceps australis]